jgi:hypothetical protein
MSAIIKMLRLLTFMYNLIFNHMLALDSAHWVLSSRVLLFVFFLISYCLMLCGVHNSTSFHRFTEGKRGYSKYEPNIGHEYHLNYKVKLNQVKIQVS